MPSAELLPGSNELDHHEGMPVRYHKTARAAAKTIRAGVSCLMARELDLFNISALIVCRQLARRPCVADHHLKCRESDYAGSEHPTLESPARFLTAGNW